MENNEITKKLRVNNSLGLHTRPATMIVKLLQDYKSEVFFTVKKETVNAKSILNILMLAVPKNTVLTVTAKGEDAQEAIEALEVCFESGFGENEPKN